MLLSAELGCAGEVAALRLLVCGDPVNAHRAVQEVVDEARTLLAGSTWPGHRERLEQVGAVSVPCPVLCISVNHLKQNHSHDRQWSSTVQYQDRNGSLLCTCGSHISQLTPAVALTGLCWNCPAAATGGCAAGRHPNAAGAGRERNCPGGPHLEPAAPVSSAGTVEVHRHAAGVSGLLHMR